MTPMTTVVGRSGGPEHDDHAPSAPAYAPAENPSDGRRMVSPTLVGREAELAALLAAVVAPPAAVVVEGEAGIGKTRLLAELRHRPELAGRRFATGYCRRIREPFPLGPVIEAVRGLADELPALRLSAVTGALRPLLPEIADRLPPRPPPLPDRMAERHRVFRALVEVLAALGRAVLVLEDLHWADEQTVDFLSYLLADPPVQLAVVVSYRGQEVDPQVPSLTAKLPATVGRAELALRPLDEPDTRGLAAAILGVGGTTQEFMSPEFAGYLYRCTSGLPFAVEELLALLRARGSLVRRDTGWVPGALGGLDELVVPTGIRDPVRERAARLSSEARSVLAAAAVLQVPGPAEVLAATCQLPAGRVLPALDEALESGLLVEEGAAVGFRHLLAAQAVYEALSGPRREELHRRAAAALRQLRPVPLGRVAHHLRHGSRRLEPEWAVAAERAADQAIALGHDAEAARLLDEVLRHATLAPRRRGRLAVKLARAAAETVEITTDLTGLLGQVLDQDLPPTVRGELGLRLALLHEAVGTDARRVRELYATAVTDLDHSPDLQAWAMMGLAIPTAAGGGDGRAPAMAGGGPGDPAPGPGRRVRGLPVRQGRDGAGAGRRSGVAAADPAGGAGHRRPAAAPPGGERVPVGRDGGLLRGAPDRRGPAADRGADRCRHRREPEAGAPGPVGAGGAGLLPRLLGPAVRTGGRPAAGAAGRLPDRPDRRGGGGRLPGAGAR